MIRNVGKKLAAVLILSMLLVPLSARATPSIGYLVEPLGGNQYKYTFVPFDFDFNTGYDFFGFAVYFDPMHYTSLVSSLPLFDPDNAGGWDIFLQQPDAITPEDGFYEAFVDSGYIPPDFTVEHMVTFNYVGAGTPGSIPYEIFALPLGEEPEFELYEGMTTLIPEPSTLLLFGVGLVMLAKTRRKYIQ
jgi:hypothetical protein